MSERLPFRLGSTSYVYPADIVPNVRRLGPVVDDVELVLFEVEDHSNLPDASVVEELNRLAAVHRLTYTVHLPLDLRLASGDSALRHPSIEKARKVIRATRDLQPVAYVAHLDGSEPLATGTPSAWERWAARSILALKALAPEAGGERSLCVENLESYPPERLEAVLERMDVGLCLDVGHLWQMGLDPVPYIRRYGERIHVVHLHGVAGKGHKSLRKMPRRRVFQVLDELGRQGYSSVVTLEVFSVEDFFSSLNLVKEWANGRG